MQTLPDAITCPKCGRTSHNVFDVQEGYCGFCHDFTSQPLAATSQSLFRTDSSPLARATAVIHQGHTANDAGPYQRCRDCRDDAAAVVRAWIEALDLPLFTAGLRWGEQVDMYDFGRVVEATRDRMLDTLQSEAER